MSEGVNTLVLCIDERRADKTGTYYYKDMEYEGRQGGEGLARMLAGQRGIDRIIMVCINDENGEAARPAVDYDRLMEEFKKDLEQQVDMTAEQLKAIVNSKNVNGKGEKLADALKTVMGGRLEKSVERNRDSYYGSVLPGAAEGCQERIVQYCGENNLKKPDFITINIGTAPGYEEAVSCATEVLEKLGQGSVFVAAEGGFDNSILLYTVMVRVFRENGIEPELWGIRQNPEQMHKELVNQTPYLEKSRIREAGEEFLQYGRADGLCEVFRETDNAFIRNAVDCFAGFEESMQLGRPLGITRSAAAVGELLKKSEQLGEAERPSGEFMDFLHEAGRKLAPVTETKDIGRLVEWCAGNHYVQQAAVIFAELMPEYLFDKGFIYYEGFHENKNNDSSYGDSVIDKRKQAKSTAGLKYFWLNEMLWKTMTKKIFLNMDSPVSEGDGENVRKFKTVFAEVRELQETKKNMVKVEDLSADLCGLLNLIAENAFISPVLNTLRKVCNYFFNYEVAGVAGSVQKGYKELGRMLLVNRRFCEKYFGAEGERLVSFTPASILMSKDQTEVLTKYDPWKVEEILRYYDIIRQQARIMNHASDHGTAQMGIRELKKCVQDAVELLESCVIDNQANLPCT